MPKTFFLDLETRPIEKLREIFTDGIKAAGNLKDPDKIEADIFKKKQAANKAMSVDPDFCEIKCIGFKEDDEPARIISLEELLSKLYEQIKIQSETTEEYSRRHFFRVVTFNGKKFDLPVLIRECIRKGVGEGNDKRAQQDSVIAKLSQWTKRYSTDTHIDLMELLSCNDPFRSLDKYSQIYLNWPKKEIDFDTCSMEELESHCKDDVGMTAALYNLFKSII